VIAGAALAAAYRLDKGPRDGLRLMLLDEVFEKMSPQNVIATMQYFEALGLQLLMAGPPDRIGLVTPYLTRYHDMSRDVENAVVTVEGHSVSEAARQLMRSDLPEFNPQLVIDEMQNSGVVPREFADSAG
jgi:chromosome segregation protein